MRASLPSFCPNAPTLFRRFSLGVAPHRQERRRLREETLTDVHPLLPLETKPELDSAFGPVVQRMNDRYNFEPRPPPRRSIFGVHELDFSFVIFSLLKFEFSPPQVEGVSVFGRGGGGRRVSLDCFLVPRQSKSGFRAVPPSPPCLLTIAWCRSCDGVHGFPSLGTFCLRPGSARRRKAGRCRSRRTRSTWTRPSVMRR